MLVTGSLRAEATKEIMSDNGLYNDQGPTNIFQWSFSSVNINPDFTADVQIPEGRKVTRIQANLGYGGFGVFNVTQPNGFTEAERNYSDYAGGHIRFWIKSSQDLTVEVKYYLGDIGATAQQVGVGIPSTGNEWKEIILPLNSFPPELNLKRIISPFMISSAKAGTWYVDHIRWTKPVKRIQIYPASVQVNPGKKRQFSVEGYDANNEPIYLHGTFVVPSSVGQMQPFYESQSSTLTAGSASGVMTSAVLIDVGNAPGTEQYLSATANITNTTNNLNAKFGVLSETISGMEYGATNGNRNSELFLFSEDNNNTSTLPVLTDDTVSPPEGNKSLKVVLQNKTVATQFQGLSFFWGRAEDQIADTFTRDMSNYYDGSLRFWFKGPNNPTLINGLLVGIRSGNVASGKEISKVLLSKYTPFDGNWHVVTIPLTSFTGGRPLADLSRMKILMSVGLAGAISGTESQRTFYLDNIRWDTQMPGTLTRIDIMPNLGNTAVIVPLGYKRFFQAKGYDANGAEVDISPTWSFTAGSLGTLSTTIGPSTLLTASNSPVSGGIRASVGGISGTSLVNVMAVNFTGFMNIYTDAGFGAPVGLAPDPALGLPSKMTINEETTGGPEGTKFFRATYTLKNSGSGLQDAYAVWYVEDPVARYMGGYENGYLHFFVRTNKDLEVSIRSANINADMNRAKIRLSEFGIPLDNSWQEVIIPLDYFSFKEPNLNFTQIKTFFAIGGVSNQIGEVTDAVFDVDDVRWLTTSPNVPVVAKVYQGLKEKQRPSGLVRSYDSMVSAFTYDQALAAMAFTYHKDTQLARNIFNVYRNKFNAGGFDGFNEEYNVDTLAVRDGDRTVGPNAWMMIALMHYRNVTGSTEYDSLIQGLATWIRSFQDPNDGAFRYGKTVDPNLATVKSVEHNLDVYAAFKSYVGAFSRGSVVLIDFAKLQRWLNTAPAWNTAQQRFNVGTRSDGVTANTDKALDVYSWPILAFSSYTAVVSQAEATFGTTKVNNLTGQAVTGFDFSGPFGSSNVDKDAVWLEGTAQMVLAYRAAGDLDRATKYLQELKKAIVNVSPTTQGIPYATNDGTAYGFTMTSNFPSASSDAWYIFAERNFNPLKPSALFHFQQRSIATNEIVDPALPMWSQINPGSGWVRSAQYIDVDAQPISIDPWNIRIYTDNKNPIQTYTFVDPTPNNTINADSDPAGMLLKKPNEFTSSAKIPLAWSIKDKNAPDSVPATAEPNNANDLNSFQWFYMLDINSPPIDRNNDGDVDDTDPIANPDPNLRDSLGFNNAQTTPYVTMMRQAAPTGAAIHVSQDPAAFFQVENPNALYLEANFDFAAAQSNYYTVIYFEFYIE